MEFHEYEDLVREVAKNLRLPSDWLDPHFQTYMHYLPEDYGSRLTTVFSDPHLSVLALSMEDIFIMKCFARRAKDRTHCVEMIGKTLI